MDLSLYSNTNKWKKRSMNHRNYRTPLLFTSAIFLFCMVFFIFSKVLFSTPTPVFQNSESIFHARCTSFTASGEKFLFYAPHSGFSNQLSEFKNAVLMAAILNRTLIIPPILDHHAVALGSCPKFRVLSPNEMRFQVWNHSIQLIREHRYISMADVIDLSSVTSISTVTFIDFRVFVSIWCEVNFNLICSEDLSSHSSLNDKLHQCGSFLSGYYSDMNKCLYASPEDCRTTVWTYQSNHKDGILDSFQADDELRKKKKISFVRKRKDVYKAFGPGSAAGQATVLAFGSLFTAPYKGSESHIDIHKTTKDQRIQWLIQKIEYLPFVPEILNAGKNFAHATIKAPFFCVQLRLLDGQFKYHQKATFLGVKQVLGSLIQKSLLPIHLFVMTDLPVHNWTGSYLGELAKDFDDFKLFFLREEDELVAQTAKEVLHSRHSMKFQFAGSNFDVKEELCNVVSLPDVLLFLEETVCSCATLGFFGTSGSTIGESIESMRKNNICSL
ncbi:O-fucosyltransferase 30 [Primulina eburnea]|uniref:O-fucosyltransferase 30 n=1 Tax=Primulina eburnea TaxID=1245227 RepID=UPI003C6C3865